MAGRLKEARTFGEPAGNDDYLQIQEEEVVLASRVRRLEALLATAHLVDNGSRDGIAAVGTVVEVEDLGTGERGEHRLIGGHEAAPAHNAASAASPIGQALIGKAPGAVVEVALPRGQTRTLKVLAVRAQEPTTA
jgi:transcription elongation factor GreA